SVPDDASAVILAAGNRPLQDSQIKVLNDYVNKGGKMMLMSGAFAETDLNPILAPFGLSFQKGVTLDLVSSANPQDPRLPAVSRSSSPTNEIVRTLPFSVFPNASGVDSSKPTQGINVTVLAQTSDQSWLENSTQLRQFQQGDIRGPINLVTLAEGTLPPPPTA